MTTERERASVLASARSVVAPRSATCGVACRSEPCTLRQIRYAERELEHEPLLVVWAELSVVAHLIGEPMPVLRSGLLDALAQFGSRHRECTISHAVDRAVASRTMAFALLLSPEPLAVHVNAAINGWVNDNESICEPDEWHQWCVTNSMDIVDTRLILHGADSPSRLETAVGCEASSPFWSARLTVLLDDLVATGWPVRHYIDRHGR